MNINEIRNHLSGGIHKLKFVKADGTLREMSCTLSQDIISSHLGKPIESKNSPSSTDLERLSYMRIFDVESGSFKSCIIDNIKSLDDIPITK